MTLKRIAHTLGVLFVVGVGAFVLYSFFIGYNIGESAEILFKYLWPALVLFVVMLGALLLAWFRPLWAAALYAVAGTASVVAFNTYRAPVLFVAISAPMIALAVLFFFVDQTSPRS